MFRLGIRFINGGRRASLAQAPGGYGPVAPGTDGASVPGARREAQVRRRRGAKQTHRATAPFPALATNSYKRLASPLARPLQRSNHESKQFYGSKPDEQNCERHAFEPITHDLRQITRTQCDGTPLVRPTKSQGRFVVCGRKMFCKLYSRNAGANNDSRQDQASRRSLYTDFAT
jgi:hypothetical protein